MAINAIDYSNARLLKVNYMDDDPLKAGKCTIIQFREAYMTSK